MNQSAANQTSSAALPIIHAKAFDLDSWPGSSSDTLRLMVQAARAGNGRRRSGRGYLAGRVMGTLYVLSESRPQIRREKHILSWIFHRPFAPLSPVGKGAGGEGLQSLSRRGRTPSPWPSPRRGEGNGGSVVGGSRQLSAPLSRPGCRKSCCHPFPGLAGTGLWRDGAAMDQAPACDRFLPPGTGVRYDGLGDGRCEYGVVVHCWLDGEIGGYDCYVAFFGDSIPEGRPDEKPYVLRYAAASLTELGA